jgi:L-seryl-tRNA(Ser) seleniumtransferase
VNTKRDLLRSIPSVERVLEHPDMVALGQRYPRWAIAESAREVLADIREAISGGEHREQPQMVGILETIRTRVHARCRRGIRRVINATGILIHTNLGRSILSDRAVEAVLEIARSYSSLEYDVEAGRRTSRIGHVENLLCKIIGCEAAHVVNNNAGAVLVALNTLADRSEVVVSRGELIEIGGSFRLPDVMDKSGARMVEVGTTNRTRLEDYENAITASTKVILKAHRSNFEMTGFVESVPVRELADLAHKHDIPVVEDLGSGALIDFSRFGVEKEPMPQESLRHGVDVVTFSGDKLLCGPQAGVTVGRGDLVERMKKNPLTRALRIGKMTLAALEETLRQYLEPETLFDALPTVAMIARSPEEIGRRASAVADILSEKIGHVLDISLVSSRSQIGGGSLPSATLDSSALAISSRHLSADQIASTLRGCEIPIIARIAEDKAIIDFRSVQPSEDELLTSQMLAAFAGGDTR